MSKPKSGLGKGLGKGLGALMSSVQATEQHPGMDGVLIVDIRNVEPNPEQPRQYFNEAALEELAESMKTFGIVQPLLVTDNGGHYTIIAGERRYRAARMAKITEVPVIVKDYTEMEILQVALIENIQRQDLTSIEEAACYKRLMDDFFFSADDVATKLGKSKHAVISALHLLELTPRAQELAAEGKLSTSHAKSLLNVEDAELQAACAQRIAEGGLSVREAEAMIAAALKLAAKKDVPVADSASEDANISESRKLAYKRAESELKEVLGTQVRIVPGKKKSKIEIEYYSLGDLERLLEMLRTI